MNHDHINETFRQILNQWSHYGNPHPSTKADSMAENPFSNWPTQGVDAIPYAAAYDKEDDPIRCAREVDPIRCAREVERQIELLKKHKRRPVIFLKKAAEKLERSLQ